VGGTSPSPSSTTPIHHIPTIISFQTWCMVDAKYFFMLYLPLCLVLSRNLFVAIVK
jgi:hypothetical protein